MIVSYSEQSSVLRCEGDEDRSTQSRRRPALSRALAASGQLLVDLRGLVFADPSLIIDLAMVARRLRHAGGTMRICGAQPQILLLIELCGLDRLAGVVVERVPQPA